MTTAREFQPVSHLNAQGQPHPPTPQGSLTSGTGLVQLPIQKPSIERQFHADTKRRYEPELKVGHTRIILGNERYVETHVEDDITNGGLVNTLTPLHAARVTETAVTSVLTNDQCLNERPPWPNFVEQWSNECSAIDADWSKNDKSGDHNFWSKAGALSQDKEPQYHFKLTGTTELGFLTENRIETSELPQREKL